MTQQEYEQKKRECLDEFCKEHKCETPHDYIVETFNYAFDRASALSKQEKDADTVINGFLARDKDGEIFLYEKKPVRDKDQWIEALYSESDFQDLTWDSDPEPVEIIIKRKKK